MAANSSSLESLLAQAASAGHLRETALKNIEALLRGSQSGVYRESVGELARHGEWNELNDRFYRTLAFGTGGLRGRTIGKIVTAAERGAANPTAPPQFPCVGTNAVNFYNISRATQGLIAYVHDWLESAGDFGKPKIVIAYDTRHFSREFAALAAKIAAENGCDAFVFDAPRSTPELSFAVRRLRASAGIVITASHNPSHDNGYKVYFSDGAQVVEPHASGIIAKVNAIENESYPALPENRRGTVSYIGAEIDEAYMTRLATLVLQPDVIRHASGLQIVFTPIHGTGAAIIKPMLARLGFQFSVVEKQDRGDGNFPTVTSPNPEEAAALRLAVEQAEKTNADLVVATDPDCDRMGVAVRAPSGEMKLLTGNQIGSLMAYYRIRTLFDLHVLTTENASRAVIIKTFVTTDLQKAIAQHYGLRCIETLSGFKYIGAKLGKYENALPPELLQRYRDTPEDETRQARLEHSSLYVFGGEESYGYSGADFVRDKDGNGAAIMFCEVAAYAKSRGLTVDALLDEIFVTFGYFEEKTGGLTFEGAEGADIIKRLLFSYAADPPAEMLGSRVVNVENFETETFRDAEGDEIPKEKMLIFELEDRTRVAVRGSGTEPKMKYYLFAQRRPEARQFTADELAQIKRSVSSHLNELWEWLQRDATRRRSQ